MELGAETGMPWAEREAAALVRAQGSVATREAAWSMATGPGTFLQPVGAVGLGRVRQCCDPPTLSWSLQVPTPSRAGGDARPPSQAGGADSPVEDAEALCQLLLRLALGILLHLAHHHDQELFEVDGAAACGKKPP